MRRFAISLHRWVALFAGAALVLWGLSGILHPIMTTWGPQQAVFYPPSGSLHLQDTMPLDEIFSNASVKSARTVKIVPSADKNVLQVTEDALKPRRYFDLRDGRELEDYDQTHAEYLARHYTQASEPIRSTAFINAFTPDYPWVNRLLPVYRVEFERSDDLSIYIYTETNAAAGMSNRFKGLVQKGFRWLHTWSWFPHEAEWARALLITLLVGSALAMTLSGAMMLILIRRKSPAPGMRGWHRIAGYALALPALMFTSSGLYHLLQYTVDPPQSALTLSQPISLENIAFNLTDEWSSLTEGLDVSAVSIIENAEGQRLYRFGLAANRQGGPTTSAAVRNARFAGVETTGPALYVDAETGEAVKEGDRALARQLAQRFTNAPHTAIESMSLVTRFGPDYDFRNKRLPVWRVDYKAPVNATIFVDTTTGVLADKVPNHQKAERWSFSLLHKWNFLRPAGRNTQNAITAMAAFLLVAAMAGLGISLDLKRRRKRR